MKSKKYKTKPCHVIKECNSYPSRYLFCLFSLSTSTTCRHYSPTDQIKGKEKHMPIYCQPNIHRTKKNYLSLWLCRTLKQMLDIEKPRINPSQGLILNPLSLHDHPH